MTTFTPIRSGMTGIALLGAGLMATSASAIVFHTANGSIQASLCVGNDCVANEAFGFDTIRLKENNLRIHFDDTSVAAAFPPNDWRIIINDSANGGASHFTVQDATAGNQVFRIFAGARANALVVDSQGDIGIGTTTPATDIDIKIGDTPTVRLQQDGTSGFTPQTWDMAGNETNFFIRDATNGSQLPFRIRPSAPTNSLFIEGTTGHIGLGTASPTALLSLVNSGAGADGLPRILFDNTDATSDWNVDVSDTNNFRISVDGSGSQELEIDNLGNLTVLGDINSGGTTVVPDYVFGEDYELMPLNEVAQFIAANRHLPNIPSADDVKSNGLNMTEMQMALLEKIEELTLYALEQQKTISALNNRLQTTVSGQATEVAKIESLESRLVELEKLLDR